MLNLGLWEDYKLHDKEIKADNKEFLEVLSDSQEKLSIGLIYQMMLKNFTQIIKIY